MDLLKDIKQKRTKERQKNPFRRSDFNQISFIVKKYGLTDSFLSILDKVEDYLPSDNLKFSRIRVKTYMENHLFSLVTRNEYFLTTSIIDKANNPYLKFAHSPEEILLSKSLYRLNPSMDSEKLLRYHFDTLYLHERAKTLNQDFKNG